MLTFSNIVTYRNIYNSFNFTSFDGGCLAGAAVSFNFSHHFSVYMFTGADLQGQQSHLISHRIFLYSYCYLAQEDAIFNSFNHQVLCSIVSVYLFLLLRIFGFLSFLVTYLLTYWGGVCLQSQQLFRCCISFGWGEHHGFGESRCFGVFECPHLNWARKILDFVPCNLLKISTHDFIKAAMGLCS